MTNSEIHDYDVLVVGAGPSGLTTAAALARFGVRVLVIEKHSGLSIFPKAIGVRPRSMEIFRSWGLEPEVRRRSQHGRLTMRVGPALTMPGQEISLGLPDDDVVRGGESGRRSPCVVKINWRSSSVPTSGRGAGRCASAPN